MQHMLRQIPFILSLFALAVVGIFWTVGLQSVGAHEYTAGTLLIKHPMARPTAPVARNGAVFLEISDIDGPGDKLLSVATPQAAKSELHETTIVDNVARMKRQDAVEIGAGDTVKFAPGGLHIMLMGLAGPLVEGESFPLTLTFEKAGDVAVDVKIEEYHEHDEADGGDADKAHHQH